MKENMTPVINQNKYISNVLKTLLLLIINTYVSGMKCRNVALRLDDLTTGECKGQKACNLKFLCVLCLLH